MNEETIRAVIGHHFWNNSRLNIFNGEILKGGAFRLRAVGGHKDNYNEKTGQFIFSGSPKRSKEYLLFTNGMSSMVLQYNELTEMTGVTGFIFDFTRKTNEKKIIFWEVRASQSGEEGVHGSIYDYLTLKVSRNKPHKSRGAVILCGVDGEPGQWIYLDKI